MYIDLAQHFASGVGILIHAYWASCIRKVSRIHDRVMVVDLQLDAMRIRLFVVYMFHAGYLSDLLESTYADIC